MTQAALEAPSRIDRAFGYVGDVFQTAIERIPGRRLMALGLVTAAAVAGANTSKANGETPLAAKSAKVANVAHCPSFVNQNSNNPAESAWSIYFGDPYWGHINSAGSVNTEMDLKGADIRAKEHIPAGAFKALRNAPTCEGNIPKGQVWDYGLSGHSTEKNVAVDYPNSSDRNAYYKMAEYGGKEWILAFPGCGNVLRNAFAIPPTIHPSAPKAPKGHNITPKMAKEVVVLSPGGTEEVLPYTPTGIFHFRETIGGRSKTFTYNHTPQGMPLSCKPGQHGYVIELKQPKGYEMAPGEKVRKPFTCAPGVDVVFKDVEVVPQTKPTPPPQPAEQCVTAPDRMIGTNEIEVNVQNSANTDTRNEFISWGDGSISRVANNIHTYANGDWKYVVFFDRNGNGQMDNGEAQLQCSGEATFSPPTTTTNEQKPPPPPPPAG